MKLAKFLLPLLIATGLPLLANIGYNHLFFDSFLYGNYAHASVAVGFLIVKALLLIGIAGLAVGLVNPKLVYFSKAANRKNAVFYYSFILLLSFCVYKESAYLDKSVQKIKKPALTNLYNEIVIGEKVQSLILKANKFKHQLEWWAGDNSEFSRVAGFPYRKHNQRILQIHFPGFTEKIMIAVEISLDPSHEESRVLRMMLIENKRVVLSNPQIRAEDPQILFGKFERITERLLFTPCGETMSIEVDLSVLAEKDALTFLDNPNNEEIKDTFAVFSGSIVNKRKCDKCAEYVDRLYIHYVFLSHGKNGFSEQNMHCKAINKTVEQPAKENLKILINKSNIHQ